MGREAEREVLQYREVSNRVVNCVMSRGHGPLEAVLATDAKIPSLVPARTRCDNTIMSPTSASNGAAGQQTTHASAQHGFDAQVTDQPRN